MSALFIRDPLKLIGFLNECLETIDVENAHAVQTHLILGHLILVQERKKYLSTGNLDPVGKKNYESSDVDPSHLVT